MSPIVGHRLGQGRDANLEPPSDSRTTNPAGGLIWRRWFLVGLGLLRLTWQEASPQTLLFHLGHGADSSPCVSHHLSVSCVPGSGCHQGCGSVPLNLSLVWRLVVTMEKGKQSICSERGTVTPMIVSPSGYEGRKEPAQKYLAEQP